MFSKLYSLPSVQVTLARVVLRINITRVHFRTQERSLLLFAIQYINILVVSFSLKYKHILNTVNA